VTTTTDDEHGLERRAVASRARLFQTIDALERRGSRLVDMAREVKNVGTLVIDGVAVLGAVSSLFVMVRSLTARQHLALPEIHVPKKKGPGNVIARVAVFALFAGVAFVARRQLATRHGKSHTWVSTSHLRAVS
jgi:hypothetical protein